MDLPSCSIQESPACPSCSFSCRSRRPNGPARPCAVPDTPLQPRIMWQPFAKHSHKQWSFVIRLGTNEIRRGDALERTKYTNFAVPCFTPISQNDQIRLYAYPGNLWNGKILHGTREVILISNVDSLVPFQRICSEERSRNLFEALRFFLLSFPAQY